MLIRSENPHITMNIGKCSVTFINSHPLLSQMLELQIERIQTYDGHKDVVRSTIYDLQVPADYGVRSIFIDDLVSLIVRDSSSPYSASIKADGNDFTFDTADEDLAKENR